MVKVKVTAVGGAWDGGGSVGRWGGTLRMQRGVDWWAAAKAQGASPYRPNKTPL